MYGCIWIRAVISEPLCAVASALGLAWKSQRPKGSHTHSQEGLLHPAGRVESPENKGSGIFHGDKMQEYKADPSTRGGSVINLYLSL